MPIQDLEKRLAALDENFKAASSEGGGYGELPEPNDYQAVFREVDFFEAKQTGEAFIKLIFEVVLSKDYQGHEIALIHSLEPQGDEAFRTMKFGFLKKDLKTLGVDVDAEDFSLALVRPGSSIWDPVMDVPVEITVKDSKKLNDKTGRPYRNAYLNSRLGDPLPGAEARQLGSDMGTDPVAPVTSNVTDDDIPF